jgi:DUF971 family protein
MKHTPTNIQLHQHSRVLEITFSAEDVFKLPCEYLRVFSPSAEVQGHGPGQEVLQIGKESINISAIEPIGQYAVRLVFDDQHNSGLFTWEYLYSLGQDRLENWQHYLRQLEEANYTRISQENDVLMEA